MKDIFNIIHEMIIQYEKVTDEEPYIILVSPKTYINLRDYLENTNAWKYLAKIDDDKDKINYVFGVPIEISNYIIQEVICMNKKDYEKYCEYKCVKDLFKKDLFKEEI